MFYTYLCHQNAIQEKNQKFTTAFLREREKINIIYSELFQGEIKLVKKINKCLKLTKSEHALNTCH